MSSKSRFFYGWNIVWLMILGMTLIYGVRMSFSILFGPILEELKQPRGSTAIMFSLNIIIYGLMAPVAGALVDRWKPRKVAFIGIIILAAATGLCYFATQLWHFYLFFGILAPIGTAFAGTPILSPAVINWFGKRRGMAISLGQIGGGLSFAYGLIVEAVIAHWGWRPAFLFMAGMALMVLPLYYIFYYYRPRDKGLEPYGGPEEGAPGAADGAPAFSAPDWTFRTATKTYQLWFLVLSQLFYWGIGNYLIIAHQVKFAEEAGFSSVFATTIYALFGIVSIGGQLAGSVSDIIGREKAVTIAAFLAISGIVALMSVSNASQSWLLYTYAICGGLAVGLFSPQVYAGLGDIYHGRNIGVIASLLLTGAGFGGAIGPWLGGYIYDVTGSYNIAFYIAIGGYVVSSICFWIAAPRNSEKIRAKMLAGYR